MATKNSNSIDDPTIINQQNSNLSEVRRTDVSEDFRGGSNQSNSSTSDSVQDETKKNESKLAATSSNNDQQSFRIEQGKGQDLTDFQRDKAKYFFHVNLDIENKDYITWEDVEFYLLFHETAASKEGYNGGDLEARLSRSTRALWEFIHDQIPLSDGQRDKLTLDQLFDTWASLVNYVTRTNQLPPLVEDLVKLGFELYSIDNGEGKSPSIQLVAFDQLFQKMNLGRPYAIMAYKILTENGTAPLDYDKIESIVRSVITSSDDDHSSHFLLPGFFKTITSKSKSPTPEQTSAGSGAAPTPTTDLASSSSTAEPKKSTGTPAEASKEEKSTKSLPSERPGTPSQKPEEPSPKNITQEASSSSSAATTATVNNSVHQSTANNQQHDRVQSSSAPQNLVGDDDESIRQLLRLYHIDDGDIVEVSDGPVNRVVVIHPERPLPPYIQQNRELLQKIQKSGSNASPPTQQNRPKVIPERTPTVGVQQVFSPLNSAPQLQEQKDQPEKAKTLSAADQERIVTSVLKQLTPIIEKRVSEELRRISSGEAENDDDDEQDFFPFPFLFPGSMPAFVGHRPGPPPNRSTSGEQPESDQTRPRDFNGLPPGAGFIPPPLLMAMMGDLARATAAEGDAPESSSARSGPSSKGPVGVEGFMMFVNGEPMMPGGPFSGFPSSF